jgi:ADP-heptose:LPS heptosyltransferase
MNYSDNPEKILLVKTHAIGDLLMVTPSIRALKKRFPGAALDLLTGTWSSEAVRYNPNISKIIEVPDEIFHQRKYTGLFCLIKQLRRRRYDLAIVFQPSKCVHLLLRLANIRQIAAPVKKIPSKLVSHASLWRTNPDDYVVKDFLKIVESINVQPDGLDLEFYISESVHEEVGRMLKRDNLVSGEYLVVCAGGGRNPRDFVRQKIWSEKSYMELVERLGVDGIPVVIAGTELDRKTTAKLTDLPNVIDWMGKTTFNQLGELLRNARLLLTNDSAPMHLALAVGCPFVAVFGPSRRKALLPETGRFATVVADVLCAPCYDNEPFPGCDRCDCIQSVRVDTVYNAVSEGWNRWSGGKGNDKHVNNCTGV